MCLILTQLLIYVEFELFLSDACLINILLNFWGEWMEKNQENEISAKAT